MGRKSRLTVYQIHLIIVRSGKTTIMKQYFMLGLLLWAFSMELMSQEIPDRAESAAIGKYNRISYFSLDTKSDSVRITWAVEMEEHVRSYLVEHSQNGIKFRPIYSLPATGDTLAVNIYQYTHAHPLPGLNFYRVSSISDRYVTRVLAKDHLIIHTFERADEE